MGDPWAAQKLIGGAFSQGGAEPLLARQPAELLASGGEVFQIRTTTKYYANNRVQPHLTTVDGVLARAYSKADISKARFRDILGTGVAKLTELEGFELSGGFIGEWIGMGPPQDEKACLRCFQCSLPNGSSNRYLNSSRGRKE